MAHVAVALGMALALSLIVGYVVAVRADPGVIYVAPGAACGVGYTPCYGSVQEAVDVAGQGDEIRVAAGTYTDLSVRPRNDITTTGVVTQVVYIDKTVAIRGGYTTTNGFAGPPDPAGNPTTLNADGHGRVIYITGDIQPTIEGLRIIGGDAEGLGGGHYQDRGAGGGVYIMTASATISNNTLSGNTATYGGGLFLDRSPAHISGNVVISNAASWGGGARLNNSRATLRGNTIASNTAIYNGAGLFLEGSQAILSENRIVDNSADASGGGLFLGSGSDAPLSENVLMDNATLGSGGGLMVFDSSPILTNNALLRNYAAEEGSGLYVVVAAPHLLHTTFSSNVGGGGSAIYVSNWGGDTHSVLALTNTILVSHSVGIRVTEGNTVTADGVLWHNTPTTLSVDYPSTWAVSHELTGDPGFRDDGYHITPESDAVDNGVPANVFIDLDRNARPFGVAPDLGADEWATSVTIVDPGISVIITVTVGGRTTVIEIPTGAVSERVGLVYNAMAHAGHADPIGLLFVGHAFDFDAYQGGEPVLDFSFGSPVTVTVHYLEVDVAGVDETTLLLGRWNAALEMWVDAACGGYDHRPGEDAVSVPICHLSRFALFGRRPTAYLPMVVRGH
jgi:parallel beta-helix repeat protein